MTERHTPLPWTLHKQSEEFSSAHGAQHSIFDADNNCIVLLDPVRGHEAELPRIIRAVNASTAFEKMKEALEYYACSTDCREPKLKDGSCIHDDIGRCGAVARAALSAAEADEKKGE